MDNNYNPPVTNDIEVESIEEASAHITVKENEPSYKRVIFYYDGGEKTILTLWISDMEIRDIAATIATSNTEFVYLEIGSMKKDLILVNKKKFIFLMASELTPEEAKTALAKTKTILINE